MGEWGLAALPLAYCFVQSSSLKAIFIINQVDANVRLAPAVGLQLSHSTPPYDEYTPRKKGATNVRSSDSSKAMK